QKGPAAVARFDGNGELDHRPAVDLLPAGDDAADDAVLQPARVAQGDDALAVLELVGVAQVQGDEVLGVDLDQGQVEGAVGGVDAGDGVFLLAELHADRPGLADDVQVGGDDAVGRDDEAGAQAALL